MSARYLLDTNIVSDLIKHGEQSIVVGMIQRVGESAVCTSPIVVGEIQFGVERKGSDKLRIAAARVLGELQVIPFDLPAAMSYGAIRAGLEGEGRSIGPNDLLIAAHARTVGLVVVTDNTREFERVSGLNVVNWLDPAYRHPGAVEE